MSIKDQVLAMGSIFSNDTTYFFADTEQQALDAFINENKELAKDDEWEEGWEKNITATLLHDSERLECIALNICEYNPHYRNPFQCEYQAVRSALNELSVWVIE